MKKNDKKRALRRHHKNRLKEKVIREGYHQRYWDGPKSKYYDRDEKVLHVEDFTEEERTKHISLMAENPQPCSCPMCGNPRKHFDEVTIQEEKADLDFEEQLSEAIEETGVTYLG